MVRWIRATVSRMALERVEHRLAADVDADHLLVEVVS
jgi:hypothetical protein